jgi:hypothetical protein
MKKKLKLPFVQLEKELYEVISREELRTIVGGADASTLPWVSNSDIINSLNALINSGAFDFGGSGGTIYSGSGGYGGSGSGSGASSWSSAFGGSGGASGSGGLDPAPLTLGNVSLVRDGSGFKLSYTSGNKTLDVNMDFGLPITGGSGGGTIPGTSSTYNLTWTIRF